MTKRAAVPGEWLAEAVGRAVARVHDEVRGRVEQAVGELQDGPTLHEALTGEFRVDHDWAHRKASEVAARLNAARSGPPFEAVVLCVRGRNAFTAAGEPYVYVSHELMSYLRSDGAVGFVLGHEMAHHDLGHLSLDPRVQGVLGRAALAADLALIAKHALMVWAKPEWELAADAAAVEWCEACGWGADEAVQALRAVEAGALDHGQIDAVFGSDPEEDGPVAEWLRQRRTGYLSLRDRMERIQAG